MISCKFCEIFKNTFFAEHLRTTTSVILFNTGISPESTSLKIFLSLDIYSFVKRILASIGCMLIRKEYNPNHANRLQIFISL